MRAWALAAAAAAAAVLAAHGSGPRPGRLSEFGRLAVLHEGRSKPAETAAAATLLMLSGRSSLRLEGRTLGPAEWLLDLAARPEKADAYPVFLVEDADLRGLLGLEKAGRKRLSRAELAPFLQELESQARDADRLDAGQRSRFHRAVLALADRLALYESARHASRRWTVSGRPWDSAVEAWRAGDDAAFDAAVAGLAAAQEPREARWARAEAAFNRARPYDVGMALYLLALLSAAASWLGAAAAPRQAAARLAWAAFAVQTAGLLFRMLLQGRPPVTNLYSSALFVGWTAAGLGLWLERRQRNGLGAAAAAATGFASLVVAHHLGSQGDTVEMMRAVLDSNFWLALHVVTIALGYGAMFLASAYGHAAIFRAARSSWEDPLARSLARTVYGLLCGALLLCYAGTVLGGIWADQSWGRFWGWDPKENGALLIVLWLTLILHARRAGYARERGVAGMAVLGGVITAFAWFGVNLLGVGLHSYGFTDKGLFALALFTAVEALAAAAAWLPARRLALAALLLAAAVPALAADSCRDCHKDESFRVRNKKLHDYYRDWVGSPHELAGLSCSDCHGGDAARPLPEAHAGVRPQSDPDSRLHFKRIPQTCGSCHAEQLERFQKSRHHRELAADGRGPSCVTCHGSMNARVSTKRVIDRACARCHNARTKNRPEVLAQGAEILERLTFAEGYRKGLRFYYKAAGRPEAMAGVDRAYADTARLWHEFDFKSLGPRSKELLDELKKLYAETHRAEGGR